MKSHSLVLESSKLRLAALFFAVKMASMLCLVWRFAKELVVHLTLHYSYQDRCGHDWRFTKMAVAPTSFHRLDNVGAGGVTRLTTGSGLFVLCGIYGTYPARISPPTIYPDGPAWFQPVCAAIRDPCEHTTGNKAHNAA